MEKIMRKFPLIWPLVISVVLTWFPCGVYTMDMHGGIKMGVSNHDCDDGQTKLFVDGDFRDNQTVKEYCCIEEKRIPVGTIYPSEYCQDETHQPLHFCMTRKLTYNDSPPLSGSHRPLWPVYGEYVYCPPQRWLHSMEHGGIVLLYHPCADKKELEKLKDLVRSCIRRHIITPYRELPTSTPFALLVWGCKLTMSYVDDAKVIRFIKENGINSDLPESKVSGDGQYDLGLIHKAKIVSDKEDSNLCPNV